MPIYIINTFVKNAFWSGKCFIISSKSSNNTTLKMQLVKAFTLTVVFLKKYIKSKINFINLK